MLPSHADRGELVRQPLLFQSGYRGLTDEGPVRI
jgi:hypothetical protein